MSDVKIHLLQMSWRRPRYAQERGIMPMANAVATLGARSTVMRLTPDAIATALLEISLEAAKLRFFTSSSAFTGTGALSMINMEHVVIATTEHIPCIAAPGRSRCVR